MRTEEMIKQSIIRAKSKANKPFTEHDKGWIEALEWVLSGC